jgi:hypothetical protein
MPIQHHDLANEFPELKNKIHVLKTSNSHFAKLFEQYNSVTNEIENLEKSSQPTSDAVAEEAKKRRLHLKDELFKLLQQAA